MLRASKTLAACGRPPHSWRRFPSAMPIRKFKIINSKLETRKVSRFKSSVSREDRRQKTSRQKKLDQKQLPPKCTTRVSYLPSAERLFIRDQQSTIPLFSSTSMFDVHPPLHPSSLSESLNFLSASISSSLATPATMWPARLRMRAAVSTGSCKVSISERAIAAKVLPL
jgi:hypothetical protein